jgi:hypothetical protein
MDAYARPLEELAGKLGGFIRARELRLCQIVTTAELRPAALKIAAGQEFHADNRSPFVVLEDAFVRGDDGFAARLERVRQIHARRREAMAKEGIDLPALPALPTARDPRAAFAQQLVQAVMASAPPLEGLVVVLAPTRVDDPEAFGQAIEALVLVRELGVVRWIVIGAGAPTVAPLVKRLGEAAWSHTCRVDPDAERDELAQLFTAAASAPARSPASARVGAAWPRGVVPPERPGSAAPALSEPDEVARALGPQAQLCGEPGAALQHQIIGAAQAVREGRAAEGIRLQMEARDACRRAGLGRESILLELVLASYVVAAGERRKAIDIYERAASRAETAQLAELAAQAWLGVGALQALERDAARATTAYVRAAELAQAAGSAILAIEGFRMAGQVALGVAGPEAAVRAWRRALEVAAQMTPEEAQASSASEVARQLAALCAANGLEAQAQSLRAQAEPLASAERP